jgi:hypothetical protein
MLVSKEVMECKQICIKKNKSKVPERKKSKTLGPLCQIWGKINIQVLEGQKSPIRFDPNKTSKTDNKMVKKQNNNKEKILKAEENKQITYEGMVIRLVGISQQEYS